MLTSLLSLLPLSSSRMARLLTGEAYKNGQPDSAAYTAGGTSAPCTGLNCQDNPIGNPCPCPVWKPCRHDNDGHCMKPVNIAGKYEPCRYKTDGTWTAVIAGMENLGQMEAGNCMCTAGSTDIYNNTEWGICDRDDPKWCERQPETGENHGNACPPEDCEFWWGVWTDCTATCGDGTQYRQAVIEKANKFGGKQCPKKETRKCNTNICVTLAPTSPPTVAPTPSPYAPVPEPEPEPQGDCVCRDIPKVNGKWPAGYQPCRKTQCEKEFDRTHRNCHNGCMKQ